MPKSRRAAVAVAAAVAGHPGGPLPAQSSRLALQDKANVATDDTAGQYKYLRVLVVVVNIGRNHVETAMFRRLARWVVVGCYLMGSMRVHHLEWQNGSKKM